MAQSTTNLGKIHVFPSETLYNQFKDIIADNDLALLKDDGAYIVAALLEQNGYVKFSNGLILQWGLYDFSGSNGDKVYFPVAFTVMCAAAIVQPAGRNSHEVTNRTTTYIQGDFRFGDSQKVGTWIAVGY